MNYQRDLTTCLVATPMDESNPYLPPRSPISGPSVMAPTRCDDALRGAPLVGGIIGSCLLIAAHLALFVLGRAPDGDGPWGWCVGSVVSGVGGFLIGGGIGGIVGAVQGRLRRGERIGGREQTPTKSASSELSTARTVALSDGVEMLD